VHCWGWCAKLSVYWNKSETRRFTAFFSIAGLWSAFYKNTWKHLGKHVAKTLASRAASFFAGPVGWVIMAYATIADISGSCVGYALWMARIRRGGTYAFVPVNGNAFYHRGSRCR
jgi:hypothetical protein